MPARSRSPKPVAAETPAARQKVNQAILPVLDPIITMNSGGIIQSASDSVEQVFGWTPTELLGRNVKLLVPEPRRSALDRYLDRYRHGDGTKNLERTRRFEAVRKDGSSITIELSMSRADLPAQGSPYFIGIVRDVSRQIDVGPDASVERSRLQRLITEQTRALATANLRLQLADRLASLGTLAAGLGHDMNNVLLPVRARLDALEHGGITPAALTHVKAVRRSVTYLQQLSDGLHFLAMDPAGNGTDTDAQGATDLTRWWSQVGMLLRKVLPKHVKLNAAFPARLPPVNIAPHWLTQAVLNLIVNAGESIPEGRVHGLVRIWATTDDDSHTVTLGVTDNGQGMAPAVQKRAMDMFFTTKPRTMGTGLGLPLAQKVANRAGGSVEIKSQPGKGTTVTMTLMAVPKNAAGTSDSTVGRRVGAVSVRDRRTAALISHILLKAGLTIKAAGSRGPGRANLWVTEPSPQALLQAAAWRKRRAAGKIVLLGAPSRASSAAWAGLAATIIQPPDDFEGIRHTLGQALIES